MAVLDKTGLTYFWSKIKAKLDGKANATHTHDDRYYTEGEINTKLNGKANTSHTHDDRYYTEAEINSKLGGFASSSHTHDGRYYTKHYIDTLHPKNIYKTINISIPDYLDYPDHQNLPSITLNTDPTKIEIVKFHFTGRVYERGSMEYCLPAGGTYSCDGVTKTGGTVLVTFTYGQDEWQQGFTEYDVTISVRRLS